VWRVVDSNH